MYNKGDLLLVTPPCASWDDDADCCDDYNHSHFVRDSAGSYREKLGAGTVYLPHSCDEWVIGGPDNIRDLIADLEAAMKETNATKV